jgi:hypothetical protein
MAPVEAVLGAERLQGAIIAVSVYLFLKALDYTLQSLFDRAIFSSVVKYAKKKIKIFITRHKPIRATHEFSIYVSDDASMNEAEPLMRSAISHLPDMSRGSIEVEEIYELSDTGAVKCNVQFQDKPKPFEITLTAVPDRDSITAGNADSMGENRISSIGVELEFQFPFERLRSTIIDLTAFVDFLKDALGEEFSITKVSESQFTVAPVEQGFTIDDWVQEKKFDVSLLLDSPDSRRRVRFQGDSAVIKSPYDKVDDETVEYIRATLLNYYL